MNKLILSSLIFLSSFSQAGFVSEETQKILNNLESYSKVISERKNNIVDSSVMQIMNIKNAKATTLSAAEMAIVQNVVDQVHDMDLRVNMATNTVRPDLFERGIEGVPVGIHGKYIGPIASIKTSKLKSLIKEVEALRNDVIYKDDVRILTAIAQGKITRMDQTDAARLRRVADRAVIISHVVDKMLNKASEIEIGFSIGIPGV